MSQIDQRRPTGLRRASASLLRTPASLPLPAALLALLASLALAVGLTAAPAHAEPPLDLPEQVYDPEGHLEGDRDRVEAALDQLEEDAGLQLFVAYVDSFDGLEGVAWAEQTFTRSGMGGNDVLLAVAVGDRRYGTWTTEASGLSPEGLNVVERDFIEPALGDDDWAGAVVAGAQGLAEVMADPPAEDGGGSLPGGEGGLGSGFSIPWFFLVPVVAVGGAMLIGARGNKAARRAGGAQAPPEPAEAAGVPTQELQSRAAEALVGLDNALRSAEEELTFAELQFGQQRTEVFRSVLEHARGQARQAFTLRQQLDDSDVEPEPVERAMLGQIIQLCAEARTALDERTAEFAELRSLEDRVPEFLDDLAGRAAEVRERFPAARQQLDGLGARYPEQALVTVRQHYDQAQRLVDSAEGFVDAGRASVTQQDRAAAVAAARASEESLGQAVRLLDAIGRAGDDLANSREALSRAITSITSDIQDAARLAPRDPTVQGSVQRARETVQQAQHSTTSGDPLAALAALDDAEHQLDTVLAPMREAEEHRDKVRRTFAERVQRVGARLRSIDETIATRRGAVASGARTRISEALRLFDQAQERAESDPDEAASLLNRAEQLGEQALAEAQDDVDRFGPPGGGTRRSGGIDPMSLILGGILLGGGNRGGGGGGWSGGGGGWGGGGGGFGGGFGGGGGGGFGGGGRF